MPYTSYISVPPLEILAAPRVRPGRTTDATLGHIGGIAGYIAFYLMLATVIWGAMLYSRLLERYVRRQTLYGGHMILAILAITMSIAHASAHMFRHDAYFDVKKEWLPWVGGADTTVSVGILGLEIVMIIAFSVWLQRRMSYRRWHRLHQWAYPGLALITVHSVWAMREKHFGVIWALVAASVIVTVMAIGARIFSPNTPTAEPPDHWFDVVEDFRGGTYLR